MHNVRLEAGIHLVPPEGGRPDTAGEDRDSLSEGVMSAHGTLPLAKFGRDQLKNTDAAKSSLIQSHELFERRDPAKCNHLTNARDKASRPLGVSTTLTMTCWPSARSFKPALSRIEM
jgi:hypothetical protein